MLALFAESAGVYMPPGSCLEGVAGASCDQCAEDAFNFTPLGCTACACSEPGSVGDSCDEDGQCQCKVTISQAS